MAELDAELNDELISGMKRLALRVYGDSEDASIGRVAEAALEMRLLWEDLVEGGGNETEEPLASWEFPALPKGKENSNGIRGWLFRR